MILERHLSVRLLYLLVGGPLGDPEDLVVVLAHADDAAASVDELLKVPSWVITIRVEHTAHNVQKEGGGGLGQVEHLPRFHIIARLDSLSETGRQEEKKSFRIANFLLLCLSIPCWITLFVIYTKA